MHQTERLLQLLRHPLVRTIFGSTIAMAVANSSSRDVPVRKALDGERSSASHSDGPRLGGPLYTDSNSPNQDKFEIDATRSVRVGGNMAAPRVFISYSREDQRWLERLQVHLR